MSFLLECVVFFTKILIVYDHGSRRGDMAQAIARWQHPVASRESRDVLQWVMRPAGLNPHMLAFPFLSNICYNTRIESTKGKFFLGLRKVNCHNRSVLGP